MKISKAVLVVGCLSIIAALSRPVSAADRMKGGMWEVTTTEGGKAQVNTHCVTAEQAKGSNGTEQEARAALDKSAAGQHCTIQDFVFKGDIISYTYACANRSTTSSTTYHGDNYESVVVSKSSTGSHTRQIKGRRLGDCP